MESSNYPLPREMELAKVPPPQEILPRRTSATSVLVPTYAVFGPGIVPAHAVFGRVALVSACLFQLLQRPSASGRESGPEARVGAVVFFSVFQLRPARRRAVGAATE